jgi:hypothetical protein
VALTVDDTTVARFGAASTNPATSGSFTPPNNSIILLCVVADTSTGVDLAMAVSGGSLTWTNQVERDGGEDNGGHTSIWTAPVTTGASMTITATASGGPALSTTAKPYLITGQHASPIGTNSEGSSTTNAITPALATTTGAGRWFYVGVDWNALGAPTSTDTEDAGHFAGLISFLSAYKASDHAVSQNLNASLDASGAGAADWNWCALEILAAGGAAATSRNRRGAAGRQMTRGPHLRMDMVRRDRIYVPAHLAT